MHPRLSLAAAPRRSSYPDTAVFVAICAGFLALSAVRSLVQPVLRFFARADAPQPVSREGSSS